MIYKFEIIDAWGHFFEHTEKFIVTLNNIISEIIYCDTIPYKDIFKNRERKPENIEEILNEMEKEGWKLKHAYLFSEFSTGVSSYNHALIFQK